MSIQNMCFHGEIRQIFILTPLLSRAMQVMEFSPYNIGNEEDSE